MPYIAFMSKTVLVPLLEGFEEIEAVTIIDVLRRAELEVLIAGAAKGPVTGAHGVALIADHSLAQIDAASLAMIALPGGMPGAANLAKSAVVQRLIKDLAEGERFTCAICAGPIALAAAGVLEGKRATCYPGYESQLEGAHWEESRVVVDGRVITSRGPGTAADFALALVEALVGPEVASEQRKRLLA